jgi:hypothetical protein
VLQQLQLAWQLESLAAMTAVKRYLSDERSRYSGVFELYTATHDTVLYSVSVSSGTRGLELPVCSVVWPVTGQKLHEAGTSRGMPSTAQLVAVTRLGGTDCVRL